MWDNDQSDEDRDEDRDEDVSTLTLERPEGACGITRPD